MPAMTASDVILPICVGLGPLVLVSALLHWVAGRSARKKLVKVTGRIGGWDHSGGVSNPIVEFLTRDGQPVQHRLAAAWDFGIYREKPVPVWYDPADPSRFSTEISFAGKPGLLLFLVSIPLLVLAAVSAPYLFR